MLTSVSSDKTQTIMMTALIQKTLITAVEEEIKTLIQPKIDELVKNIAGEAVGKFVVQYREHNNPENFLNLDTIQINFVETVVTKMATEVKVQVATKTK